MAEGRKKFGFPEPEKCDFCELERFKKYCSHPVERRIKPSLLTFGFVSAQSQVIPNMLLRQSLAKAEPRPGIKIRGSEWLHYFLNRSHTVSP
jgi:hypothetical protein